MPFLKPEQAAVYKQRRLDLINKINAHQQSEGIVLLWGNFEQDGQTFKQDATFFYYSGIVEPASVIAIDCKTGDDILFIPNFNGERAKWVADSLNVTDAARLQFCQIEYTGKPCSGYMCHPFFTQQEYLNIIDHINNWLDKGKSIYSTYPGGMSGYIEQRFVIQRLLSFMPKLKDKIVDISSTIASMRRKKSKKEVEEIFKAIQITKDAHEMAARVLQAGKLEYEVQAAIDYIFVSSGAVPAFESIVGSGKNATTLHYTQNDHEIEEGSLVVVDIGAQYNYYCADISRTYPVSGTFSRRQKEIYTIVLETQDHIASLAKPGMWLVNKEKSEQSLHHLAKKFLQTKGYDEYFVHGIGHFLGLDVHDVGNYQDPLESGDVITIEPGIYIPDEKLGVRIEDNYWIVEEGTICLSENIPKASDDIEQMVKRPVFEEAAETEL